jgi:hypothetical protein
MAPMHCSYGNEHSDFMKEEEEDGIFEPQTDNRLLKTNSARAVGRITKLT